MGRSVGLASALLSVRKSPWRMAVFIPLTVALGVLLFFSLVGLSVIIMGFFLFAIPYWFGERRIRFILASALIALVAMALIVALVFTMVNLGQPPSFQDSPNSLLRDGQVSPYRGSPDATLFNFTVVYTGTGAPLDGPFLNLSTFNGGSVTRTNHSMSLAGSGEGGRTYFYTSQLPSSVYSFHYAVRAANGTWVATLQRLGGAGDSAGPYTISGLSFFALLAPQIIYLYLLLSFVVPPVIPLTLLLYWWGRQARGRRERLLGLRKPDKCPDCGAAIVEAEAKECPVCGKPLAPGTPMSVGEPGGSG